MGLRYKLYKAMPFNGAGNSKVAIKRLAVTSVSSVSLFLSLVLPAAAITVDFNLLENDDLAPNLSAQLSMEVEEVVGGASFTFLNDVGQDSSITSVYFEDSNLFTDFTLTDQTTGVDYTAVMDDGNLPGGNTIGFESQAYSTKDGANKNGVNAAGESVTFTGSFDTGVEFSDLWSLMSEGLFRVGIHVTSINWMECSGASGASGVEEPCKNWDSSQSYVSNVPLPGAVWLFGTALIGFMTMANRRKG